MQIENDKLSAFISEVERSAEQQADRITQDITRDERDKLEAFEMELRDGSLRQRELGGEEAKRAADRRINSARVAARRSLLEFREDCSREVFDEALGRLRAFPATDKYDDTLLELLSQAVGQMPGDNCFTVYLRPEDMKWSELLASSMPRATLRFKQGSFSLGGLIVEQKERCRRADMTFDSALADLSGRFAELTGFRVEQ